jgi:hypothetical protein
MHGQAVPEATQAPGELDRSIWPVLGRAGDGQAYWVWQVSRLFLAARKREDLILDAIVRGLGRLPLHSFYFAPFAVFRTAFAIPSTAG